MRKAFVLLVISVSILLFTALFPACSSVSEQENSKYSFNLPVDDRFIPVSNGAVATSDYFICYDKYTKMR